jgi:hypothetical protein
MNPLTFMWIGDASSAKFWLNPVGLARNLGFRATDLRKVEGIIREKQNQLLEAWNGYFGISGG